MDCVSYPTRAKTENGFDSEPALGPESDPVPEVDDHKTAVSRAEIDTSAPFESVKAAATRFGGMGFWRPASQKPSAHSFQGAEEFDLAKAEEQAAQLERGLFEKETETFNVLKELERTKIIVDELKLKLQEASDLTDSLNFDSEVKKLDVESELAMKDVTFLVSAPVLLELKEAKLYLSRTTSDLADIRATIESYNKKIEKERILLENTAQMLSSNSSKVSALEEELIQTKQKLKLVKDCEDGSCDPTEVLRAILEIEQTKARIKTAEIKLVAAKKMKAAARATEAVALAEIKALSSREYSSITASKRKPEEGLVTLSFEEYSSLTSKARDAEESCKRRATDAAVLVDEANVSKREILKKVEEATEEVKISKKALEEAVSRVEAANRSKLEVEEALRVWRQRRRSSVHNSTKFKNSFPSQLRKDSPLLDVNGLTLVTDGAKPVLKSTLSIGQILSRKLQLAEEKSSGRQKVSLAQMLGKTNSSGTNVKDNKENNSPPKHSPAKGKKKFGGFSTRISLLVTKENKNKKKKKKQTAAAFRCRNV